MHVVFTDHEFLTSTRDRVEVDARRVTIFASGGESYVLSQNVDGTIRIEAPHGELVLDVVSTKPLDDARSGRSRSWTVRPGVVRRARLREPPRTSRGACSAGPQRGRVRDQTPGPKTVKCDQCESTIEYHPEDLFRAPSLPSSDDVGPMAVKCPKLRCGGHGYPR